MALRKMETKQMPMRRCHHEILCAILEGATKGETATELMYVSNTSYHGFRKRLELLNENGLIVRKEDKWFTTDKGTQYIQQVRALNSFESVTLTKEMAIKELNEDELWCLAHEIKEHLAEKYGSNFPTVLDRELLEIVREMKASV